MQVHGHDFSCVAALPSGSGRGFVYASGSEEKVIRILEAPEAFLDTLAFVRGERPSSTRPLARSAHLYGETWHVTLGRSSPN